MRRTRAEGKPSAIFEDRFHKAMDDDFNTPEALAALHELATEVNRRRARDPDAAAAAAARLRRAGAVLGLLEADPDAVFQAAPPVAAGESPGQGRKAPAVLPPGAVSPVTVGDSPDQGDRVHVTTRSEAADQTSTAEGTREAGGPAREPVAAVSLEPEEIEERIAARAVARRARDFAEGGPDPGRTGHERHRAGGRPRGHDMAAFGMIPVSCRRVGGGRRAAAGYGAVW